VIESILETALDTVGDIELVAGRAGGHEGDGRPLTVMCRPPQNW